LSVLLRYTDYDCPFGIFKLFLSFCTFSSGHCVVCSSSIYGFWLPPFGNFKLFLVHTARFWNDLYQVRLKPKDWKAK
jgi:hypothetical protein